MQKQVLIVEDDMSLGSIVGDYLRTRSYMIELAHDGQEALDILSQKHFDIILSDISMPRMDGLEMLKALRDAGNVTPVIFLTVRSGLNDMLQAYALGCDDYVVKPFAMELVIAKMEAMIRRCTYVEENEKNEFQLGDCYFDSIRQTINGQHLSARENSLLLMLCRNMNTVVDRNRILVSIWGKDTYFNARSLSVYINHLRHFFGKDSQVRIMCSQKKGYKLVIINKS